MSTLEKVPVLRELAHHLTDHRAPPPSGTGWRAGAVAAGSVVGVTALSAIVSAARQRGERST